MLTLPPLRIGANFKEQMLKERRDWMHKQVEQSEFNDVPAKAEDFYEREKVERRRAR